MDHYAAIVQIKPGQYAGEVRDVFRGAVIVCSHKHKTRRSRLRRKTSA